MGRSSRHGKKANFKKLGNPSPDDTYFGAGTTSKPRYQRKQTQKMGLKDNAPRKELGRKEF